MPMLRHTKHSPPERSSLGRGGTPPPRLLEEGSLSMTTSSRHGRRTRGSWRTSSLSGTFSGCIHPGRASHGQVSGRMAVTVVVRWAPDLSVRCGTRVARPPGRTQLAPAVMVRLLLSKPE
jgi:hypothetical protein